jgi:hypothetical protein
VDNAERIIKTEAAEAAERIIEAAGRDPADFARHEVVALWDDLDWAKTKYCLIAEQLQLRKRKSQKAQAQTIKSAKRLRSLVADQDCPGLLAALDALIADDRPEPARDIGEPRLDEYSAFEWLAGYILPQVYEKHFKQPADYNTWDGGAHGPYIDFAVAALHELGIKHCGQPYSPKSIAEALAGFRAKRSRANRNRRFGKIALSAV